MHKRTEALHVAEPVQHTYLAALNVDLKGVCSRQAYAPLHGEEKVPFAGAGYQDIEKPGETGPVEWHVAMRPSKRRKLDKTKRLDKIYYDKIERLKARVRAKVDHPFRVLKRQRGYMKARYRGLA